MSTIETTAAGNLHHTDATFSPMHDHSSCPEKIPCRVYRHAGEASKAVAAEIDAADKAVADAQAAYELARAAAKTARESVESAETARAALSNPLAGLVNPNEFDPARALKIYGPSSPTFGALVDYWGATRKVA